MKLSRGQTLVLATHNKGKVVEIGELLAPLGLVVQSAGEFGLPEPDETETTFAGNAILKARAAADASGHVALGLLQVGALRFGPLVLVQPILAIELLFVFGYLALLPAARRSGPRVRARDWLAVAVMCAGISVFLRAAAPTGGRDHAPAGLWWLSAAITLALVAIAIALAERTGGSSSRRAAFLGVATGISWGFVAAVIKELVAR